MVFQLVIVMFFQIISYNYVCNRAMKYRTSQKYLAAKVNSILIEPRHEKTGLFAYAKTTVQISCVVTKQLISAFVFTS